MSQIRVIDPTFEVTAYPRYVESESDPAAGHYFFSYKITIRNLGSTTAQLVSRHWIISDAFENEEEVKGSGVVGKQPKIPAGQSFTYESACPLSTPTGSMRGWFQMVCEDGENFDIEIPEFYLIAPNLLN